MVELKWWSQSVELMIIELIVSSRRRQNVKNYGLTWEEGLRFTDTVYELEEIKMLSSSLEWPRKDKESSDVGDGGEEEPLRVKSYLKEISMFDVDPSSGAAHSQCPAVIMTQWQWTRDLWSDVKHQKINLKNIKRAPLCGLMTFCFSYEDKAPTEGKAEWR